MKILIYFICFVCVYDIYLTVKQSETIYDDEANPIAKLLLEKQLIYRVYYVDGMRKQQMTNEFKNDVSKLILFKMLGLIASIHILVWVLRHRVHTIIIPAVACFQILLLIHLLL